jgi:hypothetical protein
MGSMLSGMWKMKVVVIVMGFDSLIKGEELLITY